MSVGDPGAGALCEVGLGGKKLMVIGKRDVVRPGLGVLFPPTSSSALPAVPHPQRSPFCPSTGPQARQAGAEDRQLRLEKALLTFGEQSRIWLLQWSLLFSGKSFLQLGLVPVRAIYSPRAWVSVSCWCRSAGFSLPPAAYLLPTSPSLSLSSLGPLPLSPTTPFLFSWRFQF